MTLPSPASEPGDFSTPPTPQVPPVPPPTTQPPPAAPMLPPPSSSPALPPMQPPPAPPSGFSTNPAAPPPGYVAYNGAGGNYAATANLQETSGLRTATLALIWISTVLTAVLPVALYWRVGVWDEWIRDGSTFQGLDALDQADIVVGGLGIGAAVFSIIAAIVLSIWSLRTVRNAQKLGNRSLRPGWACGGWFIPIGNMWVAFRHLRNAAEFVRGNTRDLGRWQAGWIGVILLSIVERGRFSAGYETLPDFDAVRDRLSSEASYSVMVAVVTLLAAFFAMRAMKRFDADVAVRAEAVRSGAA